VQTKTPVTLRLYVPEVEDDREQMTVLLLPEVSVTLEGHDAESPVGEVAVMDIVPANPDRLEKVTPSIAEEPELKEIELGAAMLKSVMFTPRVAA
jgi:hypothetical protein